MQVAIQVAIQTGQVSEEMGDKLWAMVAAHCRPIVATTLSSHLSYHELVHGMKAVCTRCLVEAEHAPSERVASYVATLASHLSGGAVL
jgi:hypothetical protein